MKTLGLYSDEIRRKGGQKQSRTQLQRNSQEEQEEEEEEQSINTISLRLLTA